MLKEVEVFLGVAGLQYIDDRYKLTERLIEVLVQLGDGTQKEIESIKKQIESAVKGGQYLIIDYAFDSVKRTAINLMRYNINRFLSPIKVY